MPNSIRFRLPTTYDPSLCGAGCLERPAGCVPKRHRGAPDAMYCSSSSAKEPRYSRATRSSIYCPTGRETVR